MTANNRIRFMANNYVGSAHTYSSQLSAFPISNIFNQARSKVAKFGGNFTVTSANNLIYINDGSDKTATLTAGNYTYSTLATHVAARLNVVSSSWICTYDFSGGTFKFTITRTSGTNVLRLSQTASAAWDMLGFTGVSDRSTDPFVADEPRNHTDEWVEFDLVLAQDCRFFAAVGKIDQPFGLSPMATAKLQANNVSLWTAPPVDIVLTKHDQGIVRFFDDQTDMVFRRFRYHFEDRLNPCGPEGFELGHLYIGDYITVTQSNVATGFDAMLVDPSDEQVADSNARFFIERSKYREWRSLRIQHMIASERRELVELYRDVGRTQSFYVSLDPTLLCSLELQEYTAYVNFSEDPTPANVVRDRYTVNFGFREAS
jgi:hypothetical protein